MLAELTAMRALVRTMVHDVRGALTGLQGFAQLLDDPSVPERSRRHGLKTVEAAERVQYLVEQAAELLGDRLTAAVTEVVRTDLDGIGRWGADQGVAWSAPPGSPAVWVDLVTLQRCLTAMADRMVGPIAGTVSLDLGDGEPSASTLVVTLVGAPAASGGQSVANAQILRSCARLGATFGTGGEQPDGATSGVLRVPVHPAE